MAKDPVCGMEIDEHKAVGTSVYHGVTYYFCSAHCKSAFDREPEKYTGHPGHGQHHGHGM